MRTNATVLVVFGWIWATLMGCGFDSSKLDKGECQVSEECAFNEICENFTCVSAGGDVSDDITPQSKTSCGLNVCEDEQACCGYACVDVQTDPQNCGGCGVACGELEACQGGVCTCGQSATVCNGLTEFCCGADAQSALCANVRGNTLHCGACGLTCLSADPETGSASELCAQGACVCRASDGSLEQCTTTQTCCADAGCVDLQTNAEHCGSCGVTCGAGETCQSGQCTCANTTAQGGPACDVLAGLQCCGSPAACVPSNDPQCFCGTTQCAGAQLCCSEQGAQRCINSDRDNQHCGACGQTCDDGEVCEGSLCVVKCQSGLVACRIAGRSVCVDPQTSSQFCGAKGACEGSDPTQPDFQGEACGAGTVCNGSGRCEVTCLPGMVACDLGGEVTCVDPLVSDRACGAKGTCDQPDTASPDFRGEPCQGGERCAGGLCSCPGTLVLCEGQCVEPTTDSAHCGAQGLCSSSDPTNTNYSGQVCGDGERCEDGACVCAPGLVACGGACVDPAVDMQFCGADAACQGGAACTGLGRVCADGLCACASGLVACDGTCIDPLKDQDHCGAKGTCTGTDPSAQNYQGLGCADGSVCDGNGTCALRCASGLVSCNGACVDPGNDPSHCGAKGACTSATPSNPDFQGATCDANIGQACVDGACACGVGEVLCDGRCLNPQTDQTFCGATANCSGADTCTLGEVCTEGVCACGTGLIRCDGRCIDPLTHPAYCGAFADCSNARTCVPGAECVSGSCLCGGTGQVCSTIEGSACNNQNCEP